MIIFDTNVVNLLPPDGPRADIIRKLRESGHHRVAIPWMVLEEMAAHQARFYPARYKAVEESLQKLRDCLPWPLEVSLEPLDAERLLEHWRAAYRGVFEVIDTSGDAARRGLTREAMALPPAKRAKDHSEGARDAAIWFSIIDFLQKNPDEHVYFVTSNSADFGDGTSYPYPMNEDIRGLDDRLTRLLDFDQVVSEFTKEVPGESAVTAAEELLMSTPVRSRMAQTAFEILVSPLGFQGATDADTAALWTSWLAVPDTELLNITGVTGHEIQGDVWYTANATWLLYGVAAEAGTAQARPIASVWQTKILFSADGGGQAPTILAPSEPFAPNPADEGCVKTLAVLKSRAVEAAQRAATEIAARSSGSADDLAQQLTSTISMLDLSQLTTLNTALARQAVAVPKLDVASLFSSGQFAHLAEVAKFTETIDAALAQQAAAVSKLNLAGLIPSGQFAYVAEALRAFGTAALARQAAAAVPKLDVAGLFPTGQFAYLTEVTKSIETINAALARQAPNPEPEAERAFEPQPDDADSDNEE